MLPDNLAQIVRGFQGSRVLLTAVELNLFTAVGSGARAGEVAGCVGADARAVEMLLNALVALGLLTKQGATFRNTSDAARYLSDDSPETHRLATMHSVRMWESWSTLTQCVRTGTKVDKPDTGALAEDRTESFIEAMARNAAGRAPHLIRAVNASGVRRMLDVGGGPGAYSIAFAQSETSLHADILDKPEVLAIARRHVEAAGLGDRIGFIEGDLTVDGFGVGYDLVLLANICHMLSPAGNLDLLRRAAQALSPQGRVVIMDFVLNADRTSPVQAALFALNMLVATAEGNSYTEGEYESWLCETGFEDVRRVELLGPSNLMIATLAR